MCDWLGFTADHTQKIIKNLVYLETFCKVFLFRRKKIVSKLKSKSSNILSKVKNLMMKQYIRRKNADILEVTNITFHSCILADDLNLVISPLNNYRSQKL